MKKCIIAAALLATFSVSASQSNEIEFTRDIPAVRGIEIVKGNGTIALKGESLALGGAIAKLYTNSSEKTELIEVESRAVSDNLKGHEDKIEVLLGGIELERNYARMEAGEFPVQARIDLAAGEIEQGQAKIITVLKIRG
ncbi:hypothetical protein [Vibrio nomapromontoriensis]|uniref:hypothetical protein n=1 Tax=Vibrio nomapromontoriensis TaxID=2910246 RepID=UPI003D12058B